MMEERINRDAVIVKTSIIGILANVFLAAVKAVFGILSHSIAIINDAVNNLSDAMSSVITIVGTKLAGKRADEKHPYGYGRVEYMSALIISVIVLYAGITSFVESVKKMITPEVPDYSVMTIVMISLAVVVKLFLGLYVKKTGEKVDSDSLKNSGQDALMDSIISASTVVAALIYVLFSVSIESYLGTVISILIIKSGIEMLKDTLSRILGERVESSVAKSVKKTVASVGCVRGAYDLILHDYGPDTLMGSVHIEIPDTTTAEEIDALTREITDVVYHKHHIILTAISIYSYNTKGDVIAETREKIRDIVMSHDHILQMHGFFMDPVKKVLRFDIVVDWKSDDMERDYAETLNDVKNQFPDYDIEAGFDRNTSD